MSKAEKIALCYIKSFLHFIGCLCQLLDAGRDSLFALFLSLSLCMPDSASESRKQSMQQGKKEEEEEAVVLYSIYSILLVLHCRGIPTTVYWQGRKKSEAKGVSLWRKARQGGRHIKTESAQKKEGE